jgi:hypothetical protein
MKNILILLFLLLLSTTSIYANYGETYNLTTNQEKIYTASISLGSDNYWINGEFLQKLKNQCEELASAYDEDISFCSWINLNNAIKVLKSRNFIKIKSFLDKGGFSFFSYLTLPQGENTSKVLISKKYQDWILFIAKGEWEWASCWYRFWFFRYKPKWNNLDVYTIAIPDTWSTNSDFIKSFKKNKFNNKLIQKVYQDILTTADQTVVKK